MSRHFAAYFAIVGTLAFAPGGAVNAGQLNIPHINIPPPHISAPTPHLSVPQPHISVPTLRLSSPKLTTPNLVSRPKLAAPISGWKATTSNLVSRPKLAAPVSGWKATTSNQNWVSQNQAPGLGSPIDGALNRGGPPPDFPPGTAPGKTSAMPVSNTGGDSFTSSAGASSPSSTSGSPSYSGGYSTVGRANASPSFRCRSKGGASNCPG
jgi:hypothetical protein